MTLKEYFNKVKEYEKSNPKYAGLLFHIAFNCQEEFLPIFEKAESEGKKLYLIIEPETEFEGEEVVELSNIGIK